MLTLQKILKMKNQNKTYNQIVYILLTLSINFKSRKDLRDKNPTKNKNRTVDFYPEA